MPIDTPRPEYTQALEKWSRCRDVLAGSDEVKAQGTKYLPKLSGQSETEYQAYKDRALFYNGCERTRSSLVGLVFAKEPAREVPAAIEKHLADITLDDTSLDALACTAVEQVLEVGRYGLLVDVPAEETPENRPYWVRYKAEDILNWRTTRRGGDTVLTLVVLKESVEELAESAPGDYKLASKVRYRVLDLVNAESALAAQYRVRLFEKSSTNGQSVVMQIGSDLYPTRSGQALDFIPFTFIGPTSLSPTVAKPPMLDMVDVNISHYRSSADLEHGRHFTALPTPWVVGAPTEGELRIGACVAWALDEGGKAGMLEFTGQGLKALETALQQKQDMMAELGARVLDRAGTNETAEAVRAKQSSAFATLTTIARTVSDGITKCLRWHAWWANVADSAVEKVTYTLSRTFFQTRLTAQELQALIAAMQAGKISFETFYWNLQRGDLAQPDVDVEAEKARIAADEAEDAERLKAAGFGPDGKPLVDPTDPNAQVDDMGNPEPPDLNGGVQ